MPLPEPIGSTKDASIDVEPDLVACCETEKNKGYVGDREVPSIETAELSSTLLRTKTLETSESDFVFQLPYKSRALTVMDTVEPAVQIDGT
jgi:hypothetical protein